MARLASQAIAGYYPTPPDVVALIAQLIDGRPALDPDKSGMLWRDRGYGTYSFLDPCAGDGAALVGLVRAIFTGTPVIGRTPMVNLYAVELEAQRYKALAARLAAFAQGGNVQTHPRHADALNVTWRAAAAVDGGGEGVDMLYLNPPYEAEDHGGRLEQRFLARYTATLAPGGVLAFIVPHRALRASARLLATEYEHLMCFRFPDAHFPLYKQVVLLAQRRAAPEILNDVIRDYAARIDGWAADASTLPVLTAGGGTLYELVRQPNHWLVEWEVVAFDVQATVDHLAPWTMGTVDLLGPPPVPEIGQRANARLLPLDDLGLGANCAAHLTRRHPVAMAPKPAYLATLLASGALDGLEVRPNDPSTGLGPILVKGRFDKFWTTVEEKRNEEGQVVGENQVQRPILRVAVLDLRTYQFYSIEPGTLPTGSTVLAEMNVSDLLLAYSDALTTLTGQQFPPLHDPAATDTYLPLPSLARDLYPAQYHAVQVLLKLLGTGENPMATSEVGTGKTTMALAVVAALGPRAFPRTVDALKRLHQWDGKYPLHEVRNVLVQCPPHLLSTWREQTRQVLPGARVIDVRQVSDLHDDPPWPPLGPDGPLPGAGITIYVLSRESAKLGHAWVSALDAQGCCPGCGFQYFDPAFVAADEKERKAGERARARMINLRQTCQVQVPVSRRPAGRLAKMLAYLLARVYPDDPLVTTLIGAQIRPEGVTLPEQRKPRERADADTGAGGHPAVPAAPRLSAGARLVQRQRVQALTALRALRAAADPAAPGDGEARETRWRREAWTRATQRARGSDTWLGQVILQTAALLAKEYRRATADGGTTWSTDARVLATALEYLLWAADPRVRAGHVEAVVDTLYRLTSGQRDHYGAGFELRQVCRRLALLLLLDAPDRLVQLVAEWKSAISEDRHGAPSWQAGMSEWDTFYATFNRLAGDMGHPARMPIRTPAGYYSGGNWSHYVGAGRGRLLLLDGEHKIRLGDPLAAKQALDALREAGHFGQGGVCGTPLYQAAATRFRAPGSTDRWDGLWLPEPGRGPRRIPLARYITTRMRRHFQLVILDEIHEFNNVGSAQEQAAHRLSKIAPCIGLTGSLMGGYASSLFANMWAFSRRFRAAFAWSEKTRFVQLYGYLKRYVAYKEPRAMGVVDRVVQSLRVEFDEDATISMGGEAPGILAPFFTEYLLPLTAVVHKTELAVALPPLQEDVEYLAPSAADPWTDQDRALLDAYVTLREEIMARIKRDRFDPILSGRLLGALLEVPSFLDLGLADVGNCIDPATGRPAYQVRYSDQCGPHAKELVIEIPLLPATYRTPKERWTLGAIRGELAAGRNVLLFVRHSGMEGRYTARWMRLLQEAQIPAVFLDTTRVNTKIREEWIGQNVIGKRARVLVVNPEGVKTGLNCLTPYFQTAIWQELTYNALTWRQANGRIHRLGSAPDAPVLVTVPVYDGTSQSVMLDLIARKIRVSKITDGLDSSGTLEATGAGGEGEGLDMTDVMDMAKLLYRILTDGKLETHATTPRRRVQVGHSAPQDEAGGSLPSANGASDPLQPVPPIPAPEPFVVPAPGAARRKARIGVVGGVSAVQLNLLDLIGKDDN